MSADPLTATADVPQEDVIQNDGVEEEEEETDEDDNFVDINSPHSQTNNYFMGQKTSRKSDQKTMNQVTDNALSDGHMKEVVEGQLAAERLDLKKRIREKYFDKWAHLMEYELIAICFI